LNKKFFINAFNSNIINALGKISAFYFLSRLLELDIFSSLMISIVVIEITSMILDLGHSTSIFTHTSSKDELKKEFFSIYLIKIIFFLLISPIIFLSGEIYLYAVFPLLLFNFYNIYLDRLFLFQTVLYRSLFDAILRIVLIYFISNNVIQLNDMILVFYFPILLIVIFDTLKSILFNPSIIKEFFTNLNNRFDKLIFYTKEGLSPYFDGMVVMLLRRADIFYVSFFLGQSISGKFAALFSLINFLPMISSAVNRVILSFVLENNDTYSFISQNRFKIIIYGFTFALLTSVAMLPIYNYTYPDSVKIDSLISFLCFIGVAINFPYQTLILPLYKIKRLDYGLKIRIIQLLIQTVSSIFFIKNFGIIGVPISLILVRLAGIVLINSFLVKLNLDEK
tara:strand:+ start:6895 stop:8079 length:1185 start_codon:yes stop_codon:yes gene_type:complete